MKLKAIAVLEILLIAACVAPVGGCRKRTPAASRPLRCYVGGTMVPVMTELADAYKKETGQEIEIDHADSGQLLIKIEQTKRGDLYVCHDPFLGALMKKGLGSQGWTLAALTPVIITPKDNPAKIENLKDLARPGVRLGLTHQSYSTLGHINPIMFEKTGLREKIEANVRTRTRSGGQTRTSVELGHLDAALVWNAVAHLGRDKLQVKQIKAKYRPDPKVDAVTSATYGRIDMSHVRVTIATLKCSKLPEQARAFAEFVASRRGRAAFDKYGFSQARKEPELVLYCGAGLRRGIEDIIKAYTVASGVRVRPVYAGSGILLTQIELAERGDLYLPGDVRYVQRAEKKGLIASKRRVCYFIPVILVQRKNPKGIRKLEHLARPGLRLGLGRPDAVAIGTVSEEIFRKNKLDQAAIKKNIVTYSLTVNELGQQVEREKLDAAIVWDAIAANYKGKTDVAPIPPDQNVISHVAIGVLKCSRNKELAEDFVRFLVSDEGQAILKKNDYTVDKPR